MIQIPLHITTKMHITENPRDLSLLILRKWKASCQKSQEQHALINSVTQFLLNLKKLKTVNALILFFMNLDIVHYLLPRDSNKFIILITCVILYFIH